MEFETSLFCHMYKHINLTIQWRSEVLHMWPIFAWFVYSSGHVLMYLNDHVSEDDYQMSKPIRHSDADE